MAIGFIAVIGTADAVARAEFEGHGMTVKRLASQVWGLVLSDCDDMRVYFRLAEALVRPDRPAVVAMCLPEEPYQASWVLRYDEIAHAFLPLDRGKATGEFFEGAAESHVGAPLSEALALAGLDEEIDADRVCECFGEHTHD